MTCGDLSRLQQSTNHIGCYSPFENISKEASYSRSTLLQTHSNHA